jgi:hypothetical protein
MGFPPHKKRFPSHYGGNCEPDLRQNNILIGYPVDMWVIHSINPGNETVPQLIIDKKPDEIRRRAHAFRTGVPDLLVDFIFRKSGV